MADEWLEGDAARNFLGLDTLARTQQRVGRQPVDVPHHRDWRDTDDTRYVERKPELVPPLRLHPNVKKPSFEGRIVRREPRSHMGPLNRPTPTTVSETMISGAVPLGRESGLSMRGVLAEQAKEHVLSEEERTYWKKQRGWNVQNPDSRRTSVDIGATYRFTDGVVPEWMEDTLGLRLKQIDVGIGKVYQGGVGKFGESGSDSYGTRSAGIRALLPKLLNSVATAGYSKEGPSQRKIRAKLDVPVGPGSVQAYLNRYLQEGRDDTTEGGVRFRIALEKLHDLFR